MITDAIITVEGLYKEFGHGKVHALNGVDAQVRKGEVLVVIGPSEMCIRDRAAAIFAVFSCWRR